MTAPALAGLLKRVGNVNFAKFAKSFDDRLKLQKTVYLLERGFDVDLGYRFNWYLHGPYSPPLAREAFEVARTFELFPPVRLVHSDAEERFQRFLQFLEPHKLDEKWLENAASMLWLFRATYRRDPARFDSDWPTVCRRLQAKDPSFSPETCWKVRDYLGRYGVVPFSSILPHADSLAGRSVPSPSP